MISTKSVLLCAVLAGTCDAAVVKTGLDSIVKYKHLFAGQRIGIIANQTAQDSQGRFIVDVFKAIPEAKVVALLAPEHGLWGSKAAGENIQTTIHPSYQIPVYSLYGRGLQGAKPAPEMIANLDILVFDIQDIGARFYTYVWTMALAMEAAAENNTRFMVLDRPNPITGTRVEGNVLDPAYATFVGLHPIPAVHGMTVGELARLINGQRWLSRRVKADLHILPLQGWHRAMWFDQTGLPFIKPSPNIPELSTAVIYPGLVLFEGTNVSEGRGTPLPFKQFGAPWLKSQALLGKLCELELPGLHFEATEFTPRSSKHKDALCRGIRVHVTNRKQLAPYFAGIQIINEVYSLHEGDFQWHARHFDRLCGTDATRKAIIGRNSVRALRDQWQGQLGEFLKIRQKYLLY